MRPLRKLHYFFYILFVNHKTIVSLKTNQHLHILEKSINIYKKTENLIKYLKLFFLSFVEHANSSLFVVSSYAKLQQRVCQNKSPS